MNTTTFSKQRVSLIENAVFNYPKGLEGWKYYRVEYGGHAESCLLETGLWLPPTVDASKVEEFMMNAD